MKFLADVNVEFEIVSLMRRTGYDVVWMTETDPTATDTAILERAVTQRRIIITCDKDFGRQISGEES